MTWKALEWHGLAGTEWRMQVGGERLGRVGIVRVAVGQAWRVQVRCDGDGSGKNGKAGTEMQVWSGCSGKESSGLTGSGWLRHGRRGASR